MITLFRLLAILCLFFNVSAFAVNCYQNSKTDNPINTINVILPTFKIPENAQPGQKIWESGDVNITVYCDNATGWTRSNPTENIYAWIKLPAINSTEMLNNPYLTFGVTYNGIDYEGINEGIDTNACVDKYEQLYNGIYHSPVCNSSTLQKGVTFNAHFRVYVKFKSRPAGDQTVNFGTVNVLQFDGEGGANMARNAKNLRYAITGLNNISFLDCSVDVRIFPESQIVNFGQIAMNSISTFAPKAAFSVSTIRDVAANCTEKFDIATNFFTSDTLYDNTHLEMGNGLLMRITDQKTQEDIEFNQFKFFSAYIPGQSAAIATRNYHAELSQKPGDPLVYGPFQKDLIVKINYN
ncbi:pilus assembly protein [Escherichia fergusonii]|uniref:pilus assembly protein n=1 Tax=Escherichia fergusonii TaxID=564 RepID=UPI0015E49C27|nr:pilus assembly protein [Escherichia fergusonii]EHG6156571.1 pilus assembly protein [Escherichia fergusonii]EHG6215196.1 pilus assembly protein [Escherichia fergusonii]QLM90941.1 pilus assembly protein [Escherichia fergusonii]QMH68408.1 pilus assembly protein [Escherichia fergusonii]QML47546.1 pilus assembly protein [Escherichia fergusonii]